jgi:hypothetical protein
MEITDARELSNMALVDEVGRLAGREREASVAFIVHVAEFDARRLYAEAGFTSTYRYCIDVLHLSEDAAWNRIDAGRAARAYPVILEMLVAGTLSPTTARMLRPHLTPDNHRELLAAASGKSKRGVEALLAARFPLPDAPSVVRPLGPKVVPDASENPKDTAAPTAASASHAPSHASSPPNASSLVLGPPTPPPVVAQRYEIRFTACAETAALLRRAQDLLAGAAPSGNLDHVFGRALALLVADLERKKAAVTDRPAAEPSDGRAGRDSRYLPAALRRTVWRRDGGQCTFVATAGRRCGERRRFEFHHGPVPSAVGGRPVAENIHLLCRAHNRYESERFYGPGREYGGIDRACSVPSGTRGCGRATRSGTGGPASEAGDRPSP